MEQKLMVRSQSKKDKNDPPITSESADIIGKVDYRNLFYLLLRAKFYDLILSKFRVQVKFWLNSHKMIIHFN